MSLPQGCRPKAQLSVPLALVLALCVPVVAHARTQTTSGSNRRSVLQLNPTSINFGKVQVGGSSTQTETVTNAGTATITVYQASTSGTGFSISGLTTPLILNAGESYTFSVIFAPVSAVTSTGGVTFSSKSGRKLTLSLSGTGTAAGVLSVSPTALNFGNVTVGTSASLGGTIGASGASVTVSSASSGSSEFVLSGLTLPLTLAAGQSANFTVSFAPQTSGTAASSVTFVSTANSPSESVTGTGVPAQHSVSLSWSESSSVIGFNIYRGSASGGPYSQINTVLDARANYTDSTVAGGETYYYVTTAVDSSGNESGYSNQVQAVIPSP
jgi:Cep192 domain 4/Abnormal spindle-like microcephaly-assoc'd, ASPM-SPD-2-Hydin